MIKKYIVNVLSKEKTFKTYQEVKDFLCSLPNHYCYAEILVVENNKRLLFINALVNELFNLLECE